MGNCCSSQESDNFQGEGRTLGPAPVGGPMPPSQNSRAAVPNIGGRTLGGNPQASRQYGTPGQAAAQAAEGRMSGAQGAGKLGKQLNAQRAQTQAQTLSQYANDNTAARDADAMANARNWN